MTRPGNSLEPAADAAASAAGRWQALALLCAAVVLSLSTWFSATAILPELQAARQLSGSVLAWLTNGVQVGFVAGALVASFVNLPDIVRLNRLMAGSALVAALANATLLLEPGPLGLVSARIVTGVALAGVYPPALKLVSTWFLRERGIALGAVIAALTLGSSLPHLFRAMASSLDWHNVVVATTLTTAAAALIFLLFAREGPFPFGRAVFDPRQIGAVLRDRPLVLATGGYLGHMWELYAMWAWLLTYVQESLVSQGGAAPGVASVLTFTAISVGTVGCLLGGLLSDRIGRTRTTAGMMIVSGSCALLIGFVFTGPQWLFLLLVLVWGISVIGDSAQFSVAVTELADRRYVGTALSLQLGLGFALTMVTIWLLPQLAAFAGGWQWVFAVLAIGPYAGATAMLALRNHAASGRLAGGRR